MTYKTHVVFAVSIGFPAQIMIYNLHNIELGIYLIFLTIGSLLPDLDEQGSYLSRKIPIVSMILKLYGAKHRGVTHMFIGFLFFSLFLILIAATYNFENHLFNFISFALIIGYLSHILGDMLTKAGIRNFYYPFSNKKVALLPRFLRFYTGGFMEYVWLMVLIVIVIYEFTSSTLLYSLLSLLINII